MAETKVDGADPGNSMVNSDSMAKSDGAAHGDGVAHSAKRLATALDALEALGSRQREAAPARREAELMAEDRARMAEELSAARAETDTLRQAGTKAAAGVREAKEAVRAALSEA